MLPVQDFGGGFEPFFAIALESERLGFDSTWVGDHLSFRRPVVESVVASAMVAARTSRIEVGFGVLQIAMRHPVWIAKQLGTLAHLSGERLQVGLGIGGENPAEWAAAGVPKKQRVGRTVEIMEVLPKLLSGEPVSHSGRYYEFEAPALLPAPARRPSLWMGGRSEGALRRAAEHADGWLGLWVDERRMRESCAEMEPLAAAAGRPAPRAALVVPVLVEPDPAAAEAAFSRFVDAQYGIPFEKVSRWCLSGSAEQVAASLAGLREAGADGFVLMPAAADPLRALEGLAQVRSLLRA
jgi:alkanesulfonate monooxygenase SsuD/methylene tetrahydromethanopterin reductase-like flavin-dependent oxidoreductase (luciferase family)